MFRDDVGHSSGWGSVVEFFDHVRMHFFFLFFFFFSLESRASIAAGWPVVDCYLLLCLNVVAN